MKKCVNCGYSGNSDKAKYCCCGSSTLIKTNELIENKVARVSNRNDDNNLFLLIELGMLGVLIGLIVFAGIMFWSKIFLSIIEERQQEEAYQKMYVEQRKLFEQDVFIMKNKMEKEKLTESTEKIIDTNYKIEKKDGKYRIWGFNPKSVCCDISNEKFSTSCVYSKINPFLDIHFN